MSLYSEPLLCKLFLLSYKLDTRVSVCAILISKYVMFECMGDAVLTKKYILECAIFRDPLLYMYKLFLQARYMYIQFQFLTG